MGYFTTIVLLLSRPCLNDKLLPFRKATELNIKNKNKNQKKVRKIHWFPIKKWYVIKENGKGEKAELS